MATTKAQQRAVHKYVKNNYDRVEMAVKKGSKQIIEDIARSVGETRSGYIKKAVQAQIKSDTGKEIFL